MIIAIRKWNLVIKWFRKRRIINLIKNQFNLKYIHKYNNKSNVKNINKWKNK